MQVLFIKIELVFIKTKVAFIKTKLSFIGRNRLKITLLLTDYKFIYHEEKPSY